MLTLPPSLVAFTLPVSEVLALMAETSWSTVDAVTFATEAVPPVPVAPKPKLAATTGPATVSALSATGRCCR